MNRYLSLFLTSERIKISKVFNGLVYGIRKIPLIGKHLGDKYYFYDFKQIIHTFIPIFSFIWQTIKSFLLFIFAIAISSIWINLLSNIGRDFNIGFLSNIDLSLGGFLLTCVPFVLYFTFNLTSNNILDNGYKFSDLSRNFNFYPKDLAVIFTFLEPFLIFIGRTLAFCIIGFIIAKINPIYTFMYSLGLYFYDINRTAFWTKVNGNRDKDLINNALINVLIIIFLAFFISFITLLINLDIKVLSIGFFLINLLGLFVSTRFLKNFKAYDNIIERAVNTYKEQVEEAEKINDNIVEIKDKDLKRNEKVKGEGFEYLNNLFFLRHKRILRKPTLISTGIFLLIGIVSFGLSIKYEIKSDNIYKILIYAIPIVSYILFKQEKILVAFYKNCDASLLYYGFFREDKNLLKMFWLRFISIFKMMLVPIASMIFIYLIFAFKLIEKDFISLSLPIVYIILNGVFFTILPLFIYYLFQPFDREGKQRSVVAVILNLGIYYLFIFGLPSLIGVLGELYFMLIVSGFIILFAIISSLLIYKLSPKTFKIKN